MDAITPPASRREAGKAERRRRIVEAAAVLLREAGSDDVPMVQIAQRSGIAPATLYNLFATKGAILRQVFDLDLAQFRRSLMDSASANGVDRIFAALELAASLYERDPKFYQAMATVGDHGSEHLRSAIDTPRTAIWLDLVKQAVQDGSLTPTARPLVLGTTLAQFMRGVFLDWAGGTITPPRLLQEASYGFALLLCPRASAAIASSLAHKIEVLEAELEASGASSPPAKMSHSCDGAS